MAKNKNGSAQETEKDDFIMGLSNIAESDIGTIFVSPEHRIKRFISTVTELINLNSFDRDHELEEFASQLQYDEFERDVNHVLQNQEKIKKEVDDKSGRSYIMELQPYLTKDKCAGVVVTFVDVTDLKDSQKALEEKVKQVKELQRQIIKNDVSERWEIGRYLHDELAQSLLSIKFMISHLQSDLKKEEKDYSGKIEQILDVLNGSIEGTRDLSHEVVPIDVEEEGVKHAFNKLADQIEKNHDIHCKLEFDGTVDQIDNLEMATHLYRVAHEAAKNAVVHGEAVNISISIQSDEEFLFLKIKDDGKGFSDTDKAEGGMGINIMRHRMELIGGTLEVKSSTDSEKSGAVISCKVPLEKVVS